MLVCVLVFEDCEDGGDDGVESWSGIWIEVEMASYAPIRIRPPPAAAKVRNPIIDLRLLLLFFFSVTEEEILKASNGGFRFLRRSCWYASCQILGLYRCYFR